MRKMLLCNVIESSKVDWFEYSGWVVIDVQSYETDTEKWIVMDTEGNRWECTYLLGIDEIMRKVG